MPPATARYARRPGGPIAPNRQHRPLVHLDRLPHGQGFAIEHGPARGAGEADGRLGVEKEPGALGGELDAGGPLRIADGAIGQPEGQVVHRPTRRDADGPQAEAARMVLDGGLGSSGQHLDHPGPGADPLEQLGRQPAGAEALVGGHRPQKVDVGGDAFDPQLVEGVPKTGDGAVAGVGVDHDLGQQRVIGGAHHGAGLDPGVDPDVPREADRGQGARARACGRARGSRRTPGPRWHGLRAR